MAHYRSVLVTGGAGFVGSNLALRYKRDHPDATVVVADNLRRRGSELNLTRLADAGIEFAHCDIRNAEDMAFPGHRFDLLLECSAEPSVLAGINDGPDYVVNTNLLGTLRCLEVARRCAADVMFFSTSRVYPLQAVNAIVTTEEATRFQIADGPQQAGVSPAGISEDFTLRGARSLYGTTKLASEMFIEEYAEMYGLRYVINRCGVLTGPWQMGKVDQGVFALWMARHYFKQPLSYIGWGGTGKQARDLLSIDELGDLVDIQLARFPDLRERLYNVGGGQFSSLSLRETTALCQEITGNTVPVTSVPENRAADLKLYITDNGRVTEGTGWKPQKNTSETLAAIFDWIREHESLLRRIWVG